MNDPNETDGDEPWIPESVEMPIDGTLDLHTFPPREVRSLVPEYLEACRERGLLEVRIVHGKGTGTLRRLVHSVLGKTPGVRRFRLADETAGSWGATLVELEPGPVGDDAAPGQARPDESRS